MNSRVITESCAFFSKVFQTFKFFSSFDARFGSIFKKYRRFATVHYSLVATSAVFSDSSKPFAGVTDTQLATIAVAICPHTARLKIEQATKNSNK